MSKQEYTSISKMKISDLTKMKSDLFSENIREIASLASTGSKSSKKIRENRKKIAWIETSIANNLVNNVQSEKDKNGK